MIRFGRDLATEAGMAGKDISEKKDVVRLSAGERGHLQALIRKGKSPAKRLLKARILLKADVSEAGEGWSDSWIIQALEDNESGSTWRLRTRPTVVSQGACGADLYLPQNPPAVSGPIYQAPPSPRPRPTRPASKYRRSWLARADRSNT